MNADQLLAVCQEFDINDIEVLRKILLAHSKIKNGTKSRPRSTHFCVDCGNQYEIYTDRFEKGSVRCKSCAIYFNTQKHRAKKQASINS